MLTLKAYDPERRRLDFVTTVFMKRSRTIGDVLEIFVSSSCYSSPSSSSSTTNVVELVCSIEIKLLPFVIFQRDAYGAREDDVFKIWEDEDVRGQSQHHRPQPNTRSRYSRLSYWCEVMRFSVRTRHTQ